MILSVAWALGLLFGPPQPEDAPLSLPLSLSDEREVELRPTAAGWSFHEAGFRFQDQPAKPQEPARPALEFVAPHDSFGGFFETHFGHAWGEAVVDGYFATPAILIPILLLAGAGAVNHWDRDISNRWRGSMGDNSIYGDVGMGVLIGTGVLLPAIFPGPGRNTWDQLWTEAEAFGVSTGVTTLIKVGANRTRPNGGSGSMPSGHTQAAFVGATLLERNFGELAAIPAYALATLVAYSRIEAGRHFPSDVLVGAAIGILSTRIFDDLHWGKGGIARPQVDVKVGDASGGRGLQVGLTFGF